MQLTIHRNNISPIILQMHVKIKQDDVNFFLKHI